MNNKKNKMPFSKKNIIYARFEAYIFSLIIIALIIFNKDVSSIASVLLPLAWAGYKGLQIFYIKMAEREHLEEIRQNRLYQNIGADVSDIDTLIDSTKFNEYDIE